MNKYFGESWGSAVCRSGKQIPAPVGRPCVFCDERFVDGDRGLVIEPEVPYHVPCFMRTILGSVGHQTGMCSCNGGAGKYEDPPDLTRRQAAEAATVLQWFSPETSAKENGRVPMGLTEITRRMADWALAFRDNDPDALERAEVKLVGLPAIKYLRPLRGLAACRVETDCDDYLLRAVRASVYVMIHPHLPPDVADEPVLV